MRFSDINGVEGIRTPDLRVANAALSQLSYGPGYVHVEIVLDYYTPVRPLWQLFFQKNNQIP